MPLYGTIRAFVALNVEVAAVRKIALAAAHLKATAGAPTARWVAAPKMHLTLRFLGEIDAGLVPAVRDVVRLVATDRPAPRLGFSGYGAFPAPAEARVVYAPAEDMGGETAELARILEEGLERLGFERSSQPFVPHLTLARTRDACDARAWFEATPPWRAVGLATEVVVYRSDLSRPSSEYDPLARFPLAPRKSRKGGS